jgi:D-alanine transaminase
MSRIVHVNGEWVPEAEARVSVFDRGFLMADGVYEVTSVLDGRLVDFAGHLARLRRSLAALEMPSPADDDALLALHREAVARNGVTEGMVYAQVTRGAPPERDFAWPAAEVPPTLVLFTQAKPGLAAGGAAARDGIGVVTIPDWRWARRDIKTVQLLYPSWGKMIARGQGADDAWMVEDGHVTEGTSNNAWIVAGGRIVTRQLGEDILAGITREAVMACAAEAQMAVEERPFTVAEALAADEAFVTSATTFVLPVVRIDGQAVGSGAPGPVARRLRELYVERARARAV